MPIYEYACKTCNKTFEFVQKMSDVALTKQPSCLNESCLLEKIPSRFFGQIKGSEKTQIIEETQALPNALETKESPAHVCAKYCDLHD
jgi:putative FmdB family regulatory protein